MKVLITGGTGYIGSHTAIELINVNYEVIIVDNLSNSSKNVLASIEKITKMKPIFYEIDLTDYENLEKLFKCEQIDAVIHFAALKAVGESVENPLAYYHNNMVGTLNLLKLMDKYNVNHFVFSSSATVYGNPKTNPITEDFPLSATNPYGTTKLMAEDIIRDVCKARPEFHAAILRYFNPVGAHKSHLIGEAPNGVPNNLMPYITKVATGELAQLNVFGSDYDTHDGTGVRDYIHVIDLARGHLKALEKLKQNPGLVTVNLGTGTGYSVIDIIKAFEKTNDVPINYQFTTRRPGDIATCYADKKKAKEILNWEVEYGIDDMCRDAWQWEKNISQQELK